ncbi:hypothetical protein AFR91_03535 [Listeria monocytogenes]|uniref:hypothetical protein n=1 Tax=Listeria monocytogenes TaxID=1639 RepID=UPI000874470E|nr:hypothetical protein [Listeria monocytogenes]EAC3451808.1 hypothetical protein [Listeria monocytogenes]EAC4734549.1 hypothetical protein [Listeria monocytogenes]EAC7277466.1 hypothetical protein [Listeria monocytogenes]EAC8503186.1 hypothetical protein [Listeria monocytogenes]EAD2562517.1 hypothetical protein [Listeria monocytogenes]
MDSYTSDKLDWEGTAVVLRQNKQEKDKLIKLLNLSDNDYEYDEFNSELEIYNNKNLLFLEEQFILSSNVDFETFLVKFAEKDFSKLSFFDWEKAQFVILLDNLQIEEQIFFDTLESNNIILDGIVEERLVIPPSLFYKLKQQLDISKDNEIKSLNYLSELFALFMIADKSKVKIENDDTSFEFTIFCKNKENHTLSIRWRDWEYFKGVGFYNCYNWILCKNRENFKISTLLKVVREYFENLSSIKDIDDITTSLDSILNRIILSETKDYFEQQNKLKDEFITYKKMDMDSNRVLMRSLLGLISTIGIAYYGKVILIQDFHFTDKNNGLGIIFILTWFAIVFFSFSYILSFLDRKKYYESLKRIYISKFAFSEKDFEHFLHKPTLIKEHCIYWITLLVFFLLSLYFAGLYFGFVNIK